MITKTPMAISLLLLSLVSLSAAATARHFNYHDLNSAKVSLTQAIIIAEKATEAIAIDAEFDKYFTGSRYEVTLLTAKGEQIDRFVDPNTGKISDPIFIDHGIDSEDILMSVAILQGRFTPLIDVIAKVEQHYDATVYNIEFEQTPTALILEIDMLNADDHKLRLEL
ncbi:PepSY domain-containing protein [Shewanella sp. SNU WT4]|uniref:PepSY domain-containing protein n=1 Tax=Shewanella sp. SNU WT4 TaxID=2590015 RepID=UPI0011275095|nr:PepSY domain-containing protein [Shewanella sp. SNU WT4]QDF66877.1 PepSY domain-containing protein [Shewanella sp. SNU WT4]